MQSLTVLTGYEQEYAPLGKITGPIWKRYAKRHCYGFECAGDFPKELGDPKWQKLRIILRELPRCDVLFWVDIDCLCTNPEISLLSYLELFRQDIMASEDWTGIKWSTGAMLIRNTPIARGIFEQTANQGCDESPGGYDQTAMHRAIALKPEYRQAMAILPKPCFESVPAECGLEGNVEPWKPGDFLMHVKGISLDRRIEIVKSYTCQPKP